MYISSQTSPATCNYDGSSTVTSVGNNTGTGFGTGVIVVTETETGIDIFNDDNACVGIFGVACNKAGNGNGAGSDGGFDSGVRNGS